MKKKFISLLTGIFMCVFTGNAQTLDWHQIGTDIVGEDTWDISGDAISLSANGSIVAIGAPFNDGNGDASGQVRIFQYNSEAWQQIGSDIDGEAVDDHSGWAVSLSADGSIVAIGAQWNDGNGNDAGQVRVYKNNAGTWQQIGLDLDGENEDAYFGCSVSLSADGSILAVGSYRNNINGVFSGSVCVYKDSSDNWKRIGQEIFGEFSFGRSVSLSADGAVLAIGAPASDINGDGAGQVQVYKYENENWNQIGTDIVGDTARYLIGKYVHLSSDGSVVATGAEYDDDNGNTAIYIRVYHNDSGTWQQIGSDIVNQPVGAKSDYSLSLSGDGSSVAVGIPYINGLFGKVKVYKNNAGNWEQIGSDINGVSEGDYRGSNVCLNSNGTVIAIQSYNENWGSLAAGHVLIFKYGDNNILSSYQPNSSEISVFPNPATDFIYLNLNTLTDDDINLSVYTLQGQCVYKVEGKKSNNSAIDIQNLEPGNYIISIQNNNLQERLKFTKF